MGREIRKVPIGFKHPKDADGYFEPGAHLEPLWYTSEAEKTCFQIYENVSEGTPVSPVFESKDEMVKWLEVQGNSNDVIEQFLSMEHYPCLVIIDEYS
ncbi:hypothetical protein KCM76_23840 [Zooshikella marina]|uniref:Uncharacterized protein n=1 Tax=Zooshikella ganghwensis TaxID=202772 RepID=A0A4P9VG84_9GAMM|nr:hypothetical protein [Zooshikella ganghwensis]MBU2709049.1 hypothetical protein [Zooshikella ganghwensis]RDH41416.1 hypothetical protein B9G39_28580 [Zooshikella ganghwensis]